MKHATVDAHHELLRDELPRVAYAALLANSPDLVFTISRTGEIVDVNPAGELILGRTTHELSGTQFLECIAHSAHEYTLEKFHSTLSGRTDRFTTVVLNRPHGANHSEVTIEVLAIPVTVDGEVIGVFGTARDLTTQIRAENALRESQQQYHSFYTHHPDPIFTLDVQGRFSDMNMAAEKLLGHSGSYLLGQTMDQFIHPDLRDTTVHMFREAIRGRESRHDTTILIGGVTPVDVAISAVRLGTQLTPTGLHCVARDISRETKARSVLQRMAYTDLRTELPNRYGLDRDLAALLEARTPFCLFATDLDRFKHVNDSWGRTTGDQMIRSVADRLTAFVPQNADVYRYTGDQFYVVLQTESTDDAIEFAHALQTLFDAPFAVDGHSVRTTISSGAAQFPDDAVSTEDIVKKAELALVAAKQQGRNRIVWHHDLNAEAGHEDADLALALREAAINGELTLAYQPQVDLPTMQTYGVEALLRWNSPQFGSVPPSRFIPIAEQNGLMVEIGTWALQQACSQFVQWAREGLHFPHLSVNIAMHQFYDPDFIGVISRTLHDTGMSASQLVLEVTESVASEHDAVVQRMTEVTDLGVRLALDDFGTGFSSLASLQVFPLHIIKVDRSFVQQLHPDRPHSLAATVLSLAQSLGLQSIAEGVETEEQLAVLHSLGADVAQGYLFARPLTPAQLRAWAVTQ